MKNLLPFVMAFLVTSVTWGQESLETKFERTGGRETVTYQEGIAYFSLLDKTFDVIKMQEYGETDSGYPLHLVLLSTDGDFDISRIREKGRPIILINNAIHPGEADGVDASMMLLRDLARDKNAAERLDKTVLAVIPFYNIGGALNRNSYSRVNQNGPEAYGFRGNARNLDLNRDFIKCDSKNAKTFARLFHWLDPEIYMENHVSNGADYQHVMTLLPTQHNKLGGSLGKYLQHTMIPALRKKMEKEGFPLTPYVNVWGTTPDRGFVQFMDYARYSTGYAALFQTIGFMPETHMLKPYKARVAATYSLMNAMTDLAREQGDLIARLRREDRERIKEKEHFTLHWELDSSAYRELNFRGYEARYMESEVTGTERLYYDRDQPYVKTIPFYNQYRPADKVRRPDAYLIPQGWHHVIERLKLNQVKMHRLASDTSLTVEVYHIAGFQTVETPYEGHYKHSDTRVLKSTETIGLLKGDYVIPMDQPANRYLVEALEPESPDSFFNWNFFDTILQQKEHFSPYVFEEVAAGLLKDDPALKNRFLAKKRDDPEFAGNGYAQLDFIYRNSPYHEPAYKRYPVYRWFKK